MSAIAKLQAMLGMDSKEFKAGMKSATKDAGSFQAHIGKIGASIGAAFSVGAIVSAGKSLATWASDVSEAAQNAGVLTSEMMALNEVALQGGIGIDEMRRMLSVLQVELGKAADGEEASRAKFEELGLSIMELSALDPAQMMQAVAKAAVETGEPLTALADIFGTKLGPKALSALELLANEGLPNVSLAAADAADDLEELGDKWAVITDKMKRATLSFAVGLYESVQTGMTALKGASGGNKTAVDWAKSFVKKSAFLATGGIGFDSAMTDKERAGAEGAVGSLLEDRKAKSDERASAKAEKMQRARRARISSAVVGEQTMAAKESDLDGDAAIAALDKMIARDNREKKTRQSFAERTARLQEQGASIGVGGAAGAAQMQADQMARTGGFFGNERSGFDVQSKQLLVQEEQKKIAEDIRALNVELIETLRAQRGELI